MYKEGEKPPTAHELMMGKKEEPIELEANPKDLPNIEKEKLEKGSFSRKK